MTRSERLSAWLALFSPVHREKPRFMALASTVLSQAADLMALYDEALPEAFAIDSAEGAQLDALGQLAGIPRPSASVSDADYRLWLKARILANHWDGTNGSLPALLSEALPGADVRVTDNQNGTVSVSCSVSPPFLLPDLLPRPAGVRMIPAEAGQ